MKIKKKRSKNPWLIHLMEERKKYPKKKFSEVMVLAKKTYKKIK